MLRIINRDYEQTLEEMEKEFPNCKILAKMNDTRSNTGFLLALSDSIDSDNELTEYLLGTDITSFGITGFYREELEACVTY